MTKVLFSINPKHVESILSGNKRVEYRKTICRRPVDTVLIYSTSPVQKVVAQAKLKKVLVDTPDNIWKPSKKYLKGKYGKNYALYIGIAYDEPKRHKNISASVVHPLYDWQITEAEALEYCKSKGFDFGGLYDIFPRLGCYCCPLQRKQSWRALYDNFPELFEKSLQMEAECEHDTKFANGKRLADYSAEFKAADEMERISIPLFVYECPKEREE